jgi:hypothetical protein
MSIYVAHQYNMCSEAISLNYHERITDCILQCDLPAHMVSYDHLI